ESPYCGFARLDDASSRSSSRARRPGRPPAPPLRRVPSLVEARFASRRDFFNGLLARARGIARIEPLGTHACGRRGARVELHRWDAEHVPRRRAQVVERGLRAAREVALERIRESEYV